MKVSDYLWTRLELMDQFPEMSPEQADGEMLLMMKQNDDTTITSNTDGEKMNQREANSVLGRNQDKLLEAYRNGQKSLFELICTEQNMSDDEYEAAKAEEEATAAEAAQ